MLKAYKYRIYPNIEQQIYIAKACGCIRFIYNQMLLIELRYMKLIRIY